MESQELIPAWDKSDKLPAQLREFAQMGNVIMIGKVDAQKGEGRPCMLVMIRRFELVLVDLRAGAVISEFIRVDPMSNISEEDGLLSPRVPLATIQEALRKVPNVIILAVFDTIASMEFANYVE